MELCVLYLLVTIASVHGFNKTKLMEKPGAKLFFDGNKFAGLWYVQARLSPKSWTIPSATDVTSYYKIQPDQKLLQFESWRVTHCNYLTFMSTPSIEPGTYSVKDSIGDLVTGQNVVVETDYVTFAVKWACAAKSRNGTCEDPHVVILTRTLTPSPFTMLTAETVLNLLWKLPLTAMTIVSHKHPCDASLVRGQGSSPCGQDGGQLDGHFGADGQAMSAGMYPTGQQQYGTVSPFNQMSMYGLLDGLA